ncbi:MAG: hypothetical protein ACLST1_02500 [[Eubacterium] siraeum]
MERNIKRIHRSLTGAMLSAPQTPFSRYRAISQPYHNHKFELYSGERLEDMVASIRRMVCCLRSSYSLSRTV